MLRVRAHNHKQGEMRQYGVELLFKRIAIDTKGPLPVTDNRNQYIMVIVTILPTG